MESLFANKPLLYSLLVSASAVMALASGLLPDVMTQFQLVDFDPDVCIMYRVGQKKRTVSRSL